VLYFSSQPSIVLDIGRQSDAHQAGRIGTNSDHTEVPFGSAVMVRLVFTT